MVEQKQALSVDIEAQLDAINKRAWDLRGHDPSQALEHVKKGFGLLEHDASSKHPDVVAHKAQSHCIAAIAHFNRTEYQRCQEAVLAAIHSLGLDPQQDNSRWTSRLAHLPNDKRSTVCTALSEAITALAISTFRSGSYPSALLYASKELHIKRVLNDQIGEAHALHGMGWGYCKVGLYQQALEHHSKALHLLEAIAPQQSASVLNGIAETYLHTKRYEQALEYSEKSLEVSEKLANNTRVRSTSLRCIGMVRHRLGHLDAAKDYFMQSIAVSDDYGVALNLINLGDLAFGEGDFDVALENYQRCLHDLNKEARKRCRTEALTGIGRVYLAQKQPEEAVNVLKEALEFALGIEAPVEIYQAHHALTQAYKELAFFEQALYHHEEFHRFQERVMQEASDIRTQVLMIEFDVERLQKNQEIYQLKHVELAKANEELQVLNDELQRQTRTLERLSNQDGLTGLYNRRYFNQKLPYEVTRAKRYNHPLTLMLCDIDNFKNINDSFSHVIGDEVLRSLAHIFNSNCRDIDVSVRFGGEEFVILFPETSLEQAHIACEKIRRIIEHYPWHEIHKELRVTVSVGLASTENLGHNADALLQHADAKMYQAKHQGKNQVCR